MTLGEIIARLGSVSDRSMIFARLPWTPNCEARLDVPAEGDEPFCSVAEAKEKVRLYLEDPISMQIARVTAYAEHLREDRERAARDARTFTFRGRPAGCFDPTVPSSPGRHSYMPLRSGGHLQLVEELARSQVAQCALPDGTLFVVLGIPPTESSTSPRSPRRPHVAEEVGEAKLAGRQGAPRGESEREAKLPLSLSREARNSRARQRA